MKRGIATFTLDYGHCPPWLFKRMVSLGREMTKVIVAEYGPDEFVKRIADPVWFQTLGTVLAFDWNASGLTTVLTGALKEAIRFQEQDLGVFICGGKGKTSRKTPDQITEWGNKLRFTEEKTNSLVYSSKMSAKVDSSLVQDGYQIYHHAFFFSRNGAWTVVQQGMNTANQSARRYHWFSDSPKDFVDEPHSAISSQLLQAQMLNLVSKKSSATRNTSTELVNSGYNTLMKDIELLRKHSGDVSRMVAFRQGKDETVMAQFDRAEFYHHKVEKEDFGKSKYLEKILSKVTDIKPDNYEKLLAIEGVGPKTMRALALVSEVVYGAAPSYEDPARYGFAHGGKDETPYPVDRTTYDKTISVMQQFVAKTKFNPLEKDKALRKLEQKKSGNRISYQHYETA